MAERILVVDDERSIVEFVEKNLKRAGFEVEKAYAGKEAIQKISESKLNLVILDIMLPDIDGFEVCKEIRKFSKVPILMLTARGEDTDKISGFEFGADDYLVKPFNPRELIVRIQAILRRFASTPSIDELNELTVGDLVVDLITRNVREGGKLIDLTPKEYDLLLFLVYHPGQIFSREEVKKRVWGHEFIEERSVDVHIRRLREKIGDSAVDPKYIMTIWGKGYRFNPDLVRGKS